MGNVFKYLLIGVILIQGIASKPASSDELPTDPPSSEPPPMDDSSSDTPAEGPVCHYNYYNCYEDWESFYGVFVLGFICFIFFIGAGFLTFLVYFTCKKRIIRGVVHTTALPPVEQSRPPPEFDEALKCSKVEYKLDNDNVPPPVYSSLKF